MSACLNGGGVKEKTTEVKFTSLMLQKYYLTDLLLATQREKGDMSSNKCICSLF